MQSNNIVIDNEVIITEFTSMDGDEYNFNLFLAKPNRLGYSKYIITSIDSERINLINYITGHNNIRNNNIINVIILISSIGFLNSIYDKEIYKYVVGVLSHPSIYGLRYYQLGGYFCKNLEIESYISGSKHADGLIVTNSVELDIKLTNTQDVGQDFIMQEYIWRWFNGKDAQNYINLNNKILNFILEFIEDGYYSGVDINKCATKLVTMIQQILVNSVSH